MQLLRVEKLDLEHGEWVSTRMDWLRQNDVFRLFRHDGTAVRDLWDPVCTKLIKSGNVGVDLAKLKATLLKAGRKVVEVTCWRAVSSPSGTGTAATVDVLPADAQYG